jgi:peptide/nickel transport system permease protein
MVRSSLLEVLQEDYMRTARAKGLSPSRVVWVHGLRNALLPVITLLGLQLGALLGGAVITETVFSWPGIGSLTIEAIQRRDYPLVQACVLLISLAYVLVNLCTDLVYAWIDPRIRLGEGG